MREIQGFANYKVSPEGDVVNIKTGKILLKDINNCGYQRVSLSESGKVSRFFVHRLVACAYLGSPIGNAQVNHKDGCKLNNHFKNLEWVTPSQNINHAFSSGLKRYGEDHCNANITNESVEKVCKLISQGFKRKQIMLETGVSKHQVDDIRRRKTWVHISKNYEW